MGSCGGFSFLFFFFFSFLSPSSLESWLHIYKITKWRLLSFVSKQSLFLIHDWYFNTFFLFCVFCFGFFYLRPPFVSAVSIFNDIFEPVSSVRRTIMSLFIYFLSKLKSQMNLQRCRGVIDQFTSSRRRLAFENRVD